MGRGKSWSPEVRRAVLERFADGRGPTSVAKALGLSVATVKKHHSLFLRGLLPGAGADAGAGAGRPSALSREEKQELRAFVDENPETSVSEVTKELSTRFARPLSRSTVHRVLREGLQPLKHVRHQHIRDANHEKRLLWCRRMTLTILRASRRIRLPLPIRARPISAFWVQDEKLFRLEGQFSPQNHRVWVTNEKTKRELLLPTSPERHLLRQSTSQASRLQGVMVALAVNSEHGISPAHVVQPNVKVNSDYFIQYLENELAPYVLSRSGPGNAVLLLDNAPSHHSVRSREWLNGPLKEAGVDHMFQPPQSPDLNALDYHFWSLLAKAVGKSTTTIELTGKIMAAINNVNEQWHLHRRALTEGFVNRCYRCIAADGGVFES